MKVTCDSCGATYSIADNKVRGRKVKIRCKSCGTAIVVDAQEAAPAPAQEPAAAAPAAEAQAQVPPATPFAQAPVDDGIEWSVNLSDTDQRQMTTQQVVEAWQAGLVTGDAYVWREGMGDWVPVLESPEFAPWLSGAPAAPAPEPAPSPAAAAAPAPAPEPAPVPVPEPPAFDVPVAAAQPAARIAGGRGQTGADLFAGAAKAGSVEDELHTSAHALPQAGSTAYDDEKPTGARNENSVLFSLDSLKSGFAGGAPRGGDAPAPRSADDPFGMGAGGIAAMGGMSTGFNLATNQALLTAPAPPEPAPKPMVAVRALSDSLIPQGQSKRFWMIGGGAVALVMLLGVGIGVAVGGGDDEAQAQALASASAMAAQAQKEREAAEAKAATERKKAEEAKKLAEEAAAKAAEAKAAASAGSKDKEEESSSASKGSASRGKGGGAAPKAAPAAPAGPAQPFNRGAAVSALSSAAAGASGCKKPGGPTGSGKVTITFAPSGRVTTATVNGPPFAGTPVGGCVASVFRRAKVPAFSGSAVRVSKSFSIQ